MPITQQRLIDLLTAAEDLEQALNEHVRLVINASLATDPLDLQERVNIIANQPLSSYLLDPIKTTNTITAERERIRFTRSENARRRAKSHPAPTPEQAATAFFDKLYEESDSFSLPPSSIPEKKEPTK